MAPDFCRFRPFFVYPCPQEVHFLLTPVHKG